ncbi:MAG TPA: T9SS type A sorting domain-containing protein, partial [Chryseosolibacter sp.]|nr:T9SS type A sorting domain-containing protein [Chryseosolibacter sp.]
VTVRSSHPGAFVWVTDPGGRVLRREALGQGQPADIEFPAPGIYFITFEQEGIRRVKKIVIHGNTGN